MIQLLLFQRHARLKMEIQLQKLLLKQQELRQICKSRKTIL